MKVVLLFGVALLFPLSVNALTLEKAAICDGNPATKSPEELDAGKKISSAYKSASIDAETCIGWSNAGDGDVWYDVTEKYIRAINVSSGSYLTGWPLTPWLNHLFLAGEYDASAEEGSNVRGEDFTLPSDPLQVITTRTANYYNHSNYSSPGCLNKTPLRYGDIDGDGKPELAIFSDSTVIFFSPKEGKIIFSYHYQLNDEMTPEDAALVFQPLYSDTDPQYIASSGQDNLVRMIFPAQRSLSKIYLQDFNGDKIPDLVLWRKMYRSNLRNNSTEGFHLLAQTWVHYQLTDGEYQPQTTDEATIKTWLTDNNLTWQKGYPDKSECAGEEGKPLPEMSDPLLNDPEVLQ